MNQACNSGPIDTASSSSDSSPRPYYLTVNAGSSSIKFAGYALADQSEHLQLLFQGQIDDRGGGEQVSLSVSRNGEQHTRMLSAEAGGLSLEPVLNWLNSQGLVSALQGIGHRVVHGGEAFQQPVLIDVNVLDAIAACNRFAPLHNPANLGGIRACQTAFPGIPQVAVFDTAFHQTLSEAHFLYAVPYQWYQEHGVRRYGFHGTSHQYVAQQAETRLGLAQGTGRFVSLHLGNGCSAAAIEAGQCVDTSMGLTPLEGLMMGTRSGDLDPGLHEYLCQQLQCDISELTRQLNKASGLLGVSGLTSDMRQIQQAMDAGHEGATRAFAMFCLRAAKAVAAMRVSLTALDAVIFTGGIGEHSSAVRARVLSHLHWLTPPLCSQANQDHGSHTAGIITARGEVPSSVHALVVPTDEEIMIAHHVHTLLAKEQPLAEGVFHE